MTKNKQRNSRIPRFKSREEEARFWDTHDFTDYMKEFTPTEHQSSRIAESFPMIYASAGGSGKERNRVYSESDRTIS